MRTQLPPSSDLSDSYMRTPLPEAPFSSYGTKTISLSPPSSDLSDSYMRTPPLEAPFSSYGTKTIITGTTFTRSIRSLHANTPAGGSVFKLRHQDHHHWHHLHQIYQILTCEHPRRRLRFQVTAPRPSPLSPPSPDLSEPCMQTPPPEAPFSISGTNY